MNALSAKKKKEAAGVRCFFPFLLSGILAFISKMLKNDKAKKRVNTLPSGTIKFTIKFTIFRGFNHYVSFVWS